MCTSQLQRVIAPASDGAVRTVDLGGTERTVSLVAYEGDAPALGSWLVVHSGYAIGKVPDEDVDSTIAEWARADEAAPADVEVVR